MTFGLATENRFHEARRAGSPGPGEYKASRTYDKAKATSPPSCKFPKGTRDLVEYYKSSGTIPPTPGPEYEVSSLFDLFAEKASRPSSSFGTSKRGSFGVSPMHATPGVGSYEPTYLNAFNEQEKELGATYAFGTNRRFDEPLKLTQRPGPASYMNPDSFAAAGIKSQRPSSSMGTSTRGGALGALSDSPGPSAYRQLSFTDRIEKATRPTSAFGTSSRVTAEVHERSPGPAKYDRKSTFDVEKKGSQTVGTANRFDEYTRKKVASPGPGQYSYISFDKATGKSIRVGKEPKDFFAYLAKTGGVNVESPGPGSYNPENKKPNIKPAGAPSSSFGTGKRFPKRLVTSDETPSPGTYKENSMFKAQKENKPTSSFGTDRRATNAVVRGERPGPGSYAQPSKFDGKKNTQQFKGKGGRQAGGFNASTLRFEGGPLAVEDDVLPGPANYVSAERTITKTAAKKSNIDSTFGSGNRSIIATKSQTPAPGDYEIDRSLGQKSANARAR